MKPHVERMINERTQLNEKIEKLDAFISGNETFSTLPEEEKYDMVLQLDAMNLYSKILAHRIFRALANEPADAVSDEK